MPRPGRQASTSTGRVGGGRRRTWAIAEGLDGFPTPRNLLVQYTPNAWGYKGLNLGFCRWLLARRRARGDEIRVIFHEVAYPWQLRDRPTRWLLAAGHRWMARTLLKAGTHVDVTTPAWERLLKAVAPGDRRPIGWRPVPSNIPVVGDAEAVDAVRRRFAPGGESVVGSFSSFSSLTGPLLAAVLPGLLRDRPDRVGLLIGQGGERMLTPGTSSGNLFATGPLTPAQVSAHLAACDLVIQPYPDGITTRRTMRDGLAGARRPARDQLRAPHRTVLGGNGCRGCGDPPGRSRALVETLLADGRQRERLGAAGRAVYESRFVLERTVEALLAAHSRRQRPGVLKFPRQGRRGVRSLHRATPACADPPQPKKPIRAGPCPKLPSNPGLNADLSLAMGPRPRPVGRASVSSANPSWGWVEWVILLQTFIPAPLLFISRVLGGPSPGADLRLPGGRGRPGDGDAEWQGHRGVDLSSRRGPG